MRLVRIAINISIKGRGGFQIHQLYDQVELRYFVCGVRYTCLHMLQYLTSGGNSSEFLFSHVLASNWYSTVLLILNVSIEEIYNAYTCTSSLLTCSTDDSLISHHARHPGHTDELPTLDNVKRVCWQECIWALLNRWYKNIQRVY